MDLRGDGECFHRNSSWVGCEMRDLAPSSTSTAASHVYMVNLRVSGGVATMSGPNKDFGAQRIAVGTRSLSPGLW